MHIISNINILYIYKCLLADAFVWVRDVISIGPL